MTGKTHFIMPQTQRSEAKSKIYIHIQILNASQFEALRFNATP